MRENYQSCFTIFNQSQGVLTVSHCTKYFIRSGVKTIKYTQRHKEFFLAQWLFRYKMTCETVIFSSFQSPWHYSTFLHLTTPPDTVTRHCWPEVCLAKLPLDAGMISFHVYAILVLRRPVRRPLSSVAFLPTWPLPFIGELNARY